MRIGYFEHATLQMLLCLSIMTAGDCADLSKVRNDVSETKGSNLVSTKKSGRKGKGAKKPDIADPVRLSEIVEKSIIAVESPGEDGTVDPELPVKGRISSTVGLRPDPINGEIRMHNGIDIAIAAGSHVWPVAAGRVAYSGMQPGYGNMVIVQHDDGMISIYAHHLRNLVKSGERVGKETVIAYSGSTGHSTGPHLHFEAWQGGRNVTRAFLPAFSGNRIEASSHGSLEETNLRRVIMSDGTILFVEAVGKKGR